MPKKPKTLAVQRVEVLRPSPKIPDARAAIEQLVEQKIAEMMSGGDAIFQPFFQPKAITDAIRKLQTVPHQRKWSTYFEKFGCLICEKSDRPHRSLGMCGICHPKIAHRLQTILRFTEGEEQSDAPPYNPDRLTNLAHAAVRRRS